MLNRKKDSVVARKLKGCGTGTEPGEALRIKQAWAMIGAGGDRMQMVLSIK